MQVKQVKTLHVIAKIHVIITTQKQPSCEKMVQPLKAWVKKVVKSKVAAKK